MNSNFAKNLYEDAADDYDEALDYFMNNAYTVLTNPYNYKIGPYPD